MASVYLNTHEDVEDCIKIIEDGLTYKDEFSDIEKLSMYTNLAFYYDYETDEDEKAIEYLESAVLLNGYQANPYDALGVKLSKFNKVRARDLFYTASKLNDENKYTYNLAVHLYNIGEVEESKGYFEKIMKEYPDDERILFGYCACLSKLGNKKETLELLYKISDLNEFEYLGESDVADIFFELGKFEEHNNMYDNAKCKYYYSVDIYDKYFYSLYVQGKLDQLNKLYNEIIQNKKMSIKEVIEDDTGDYTDEEKYEIERDFNREIEEFENIYKKIVHEGFKPTGCVKLEFKYGCYLIDCIMHEDI